MRAHRLFGLTALFMVACGATTEAPGAKATDGSASNEPANTEDACPAAADLGVVAERACVGEVAPCSGGQDCLFTGLANTFRAAIVSCNVYCGDYAVGVRNGCISQLIGHALPSDGGVAGDAMRCVETEVLGRRWACAASDGWYRAYLGSCTIN